MTSKYERELKTAGWVATAVIIAWLTILILIGFATFEFVSEVKEHGLKSVIEEIWEGPQHVE